MDSSEITVYLARKVITMDPGRPTAAAVAIRDGRVLSTGTLETMRPWLERYPHVVDDTFRDKVIMPGFIDPHTHFATSSGYLTLPYIGPIDSPGSTGINPGLATREQIARHLRRVDRSLAPGVPLVAWGLDPISQGGHLHRDELDAICPDRPVWVVSYAPHFIYANSRAIERAGVPADTTVHGVGRYPDGRLNGQFLELEAHRVAMDESVATIARSGGREGMMRMGRLACRAGITTTAEMVFGITGFDSEWELHDLAVNDPAFPARMALVPIENRLYHDHGAHAVDFLRHAQGRSNEKLFFHGVKFFADGSFPAMSLRLRYPGYLDGTNGVRNDIPWEELHLRMLPYWQAGIQIHCHANGDESIDAALDALARLLDTRPRFDHRFTLEHYCISAPDQARRARSLGALASVNNYFVHYRSQLHAGEGFGPDRSEAIARLGTLEREGVVFALHSDYSLTLVPLHPLTAAWVAVNRLALDGTTVMAPEERIGVDRALRAITVDAAYVLGMERVVGSLEPGKYADFVILEDDPYAVDPGALKDIGIWGTALSGTLHPAFAMRSP